MRYASEFRSRPVRRRPVRGRPRDVRIVPRYDGEFRPRRRFGPGGGYTGRGEARRYGDAPVPYGPEHTYDYHLGDRFGYGPDFYAGEERIGHRRGPQRRRRPRW